MFAIKISHAAEIEQRVRKAALFMPSRTPFAQCSVGNTETYYLYTEPIDPWPMPDARALEAAGLILKGDAGDDVPMTTVAINPKKPGVSMTAVARK